MEDGSKMYGNGGGDGSNWKYILFIIVVPLAVALIKALVTAGE